MKRIDPNDPANLAKLPRWAQQEIDRLKRNEEHYLKKLNAGPEDSDTFADPYASGKRPLGRGTLIEFVLGQNKHGRDQSVRVRTEQLRDGTVLLNVSGSDGLTVYPRASNSIEIGGRTH